MSQAGDLTSELEAARRALRVGAPDEALAALLSSWRVRRHPRLAALVDHVSSLATARRPKISGKTSAARRAEWERVEALRDPADLGRLLAVPWPGKWQEAIPVSERLFGWPDDPRVAVALAEVCVTAKYDSWKTHGFYLPVLSRIEALGDRRAADVLRPNDGALRGYYEKAPLALQRRVIAALDALPVPHLSPAEEAAVSELERGFAGAAASARTEDELFEAVLAAPDDAGARAVWADVLAARGEPRGELTALMLAEEGRSTPRATRRVAALLKKHARELAGDLDEVLEDAPRTYERGLLAGGVLRGLSSLEKLAARAPRHVLRVLDARNVAELPFPLDRLPTLRSLHGLGGEQAAALARGAPSALRSLSFARAPETAQDRSAVAAAAAFPSLELLGAPSDCAPWLLEAPVLGRISTLAASSNVELAVWMTALRGRRDARAGGPARLLYRGSFLLEGGWHLEAAPRADGSTFDVVASWRGAEPARAGDLVTFLGSLPPDLLSGLTVDAADIDPAEGGSARIERALGRMTALERVSLAWAPSVSATTLPRGRPRGAFDGGEAGPRLLVSLWGLDLAEPYSASVLALYDALAPLDLGLDTVDELYGHLLAANPRGTLEQLARAYDASPHRICLSREDAPSICGRVSTHDGSFELSLPWPLPVDLMGWLEGVVDSRGFRQGHARLRLLRDIATLPELAPFSADVPDRAYPVWLAGQRVRGLVDEAAFLGLGIPGVRLRATKAALVAELADDPGAAVPAERGLAFARALRPLLEAAFLRRWGYHPVALAVERLLPAARAIGLVDEVEVPREPGRVADTYRVSTEPGDVHSPWELRLTRVEGNDQHRGLVLHVQGPFVRPTFQAYRVTPRRNGYGQETTHLGRLPASSLEEATASLDGLARRELAAAST